jgi:hypothetical protein
MKYYRPFSIVLLIFLVACNVIMRIPATPEINPLLTPYVNTFLKLCDSYKTDCSKINDFKIELVKMNKFDKFYKLLGVNGYVIGHCWTGTNEIDINIDYFERANNAEIEQVMIHELGHCILDLEHTEEKTAIMNPYSIFYADYVKDYNKLMNDFFSCRENCPALQFNERNY